MEIIKCIIPNYPEHPSGGGIVTRLYENDIVEILIRGCGRFEHPKKTAIVSKEASKPVLIDIEDPNKKYKLDDIREFIKLIKKAGE